MKDINFEEKISDFTKNLENIIKFINNYKNKIDLYIINEGNNFNKNNNINESLKEFFNGNQLFIEIYYQ